MKKILYRLQPILYPLITWYYRKPRKISKRNIKFTLQDSVFHPSLYHSTDVLLDFIITKKLDTKNILELGCGSGFISLYISKHYNCSMYASDINPKAVQGLQKNANDLTLDIRVIQSDVFDEIEQLDFDYILINPPYFSKSIDSADEYAFFTGADYAYFRKFFKQVKNFVENGSKPYMILSENVKIEDIVAIAESNALCLIEQFRAIRFHETFSIYLIAKL